MTKNLREHQGKIGGGGRGEGEGVEGQSRVEEWNDLNLVILVAKQNKK